MRSRKRDQLTSVRDWVLRTVATAGAVVIGLAALVTPASADTGLAAPTAAPFGLLGPVGIVAVGIGVVGMIAGLARRRRDALARSVAARGAAADRATAERAARVADTHAETYGETYAAAQPQRRRQRIPAPSRPPAVEQTSPQPAVGSGRAA